MNIQVAPLLIKRKNCSKQGKQTQALMCNFCRNTARDHVGLHEGQFLRIFFFRLFNYICLLIAIYLCSKNWEKGEKKKVIPISSA